jgi:hypothetical protein
MKYGYVRFYVIGRIEVEETFEETIEETGYDFALSANKVLSGESSMEAAVERDVKIIYKQSYTPNKVDFVREFADLIQNCGGDSDRAHALLVKGIEDQLTSMVDDCVFVLVEQELDSDPEDGDLSVNPDGEDDADDEEDEDEDEDEDEGDEDGKEEH